MRLRLSSLILVIAAALPLLSLPGASAAGTNPLADRRIEVQLSDSSVVKGILLEVREDRLVVDRGGPNSLLRSAKVDLERARVTGIRRPGRTEFLPLPAEATDMVGVLIALDPDLFPVDASGRRVAPSFIRVRKYDNLPVLGFAILGGVYAGNRFGRASAERELATYLENNDPGAHTADLRDSAESHEKQAIYGMSLALASLIVACLPSYEEIPIPALSFSSHGEASLMLSWNLSRGNGREDSRPR
jgi:hypothetical protein